MKQEQVPQRGMGELSGGDPASEQASNPLRGLKARVGGVKGEEDVGGSPGGPRRSAPPPGFPRAATAGTPHWARAIQSKTPSATTAQGGAETFKPKHRLGAGEGLEPGSPVGLYGPADEPADERAGGVGNDDHSGEPLPAPFHEQSAGPEHVGVEARRLKSFPQSASRRVAEAEPQGGVKADAPGSQVHMSFGAVPEPTGVEPSRRRQQGGVSRRQRGVPSPPRSGWTSGGPRRKPWTAVQPRDGLRQGQAIDPLDEV